MSSLEKSSGKGGMSQEIKDIIGVATAIGSTVAAVAGMGIAVWVANTQRRLQERQIQQDLFDKWKNS